VLSQRLRELSFLNNGITIVIVDERSDKNHEFHYKGGISSFVEYLNQNKTKLHPKPIYLEADKDNVHLEIAIQYNEGYSKRLLLRKQHQHD